MHGFRTFSLWIRSNLLRWRTLYFTTTFAWITTYILFYYANFPYQIEQGDTIIYIYGGTVQLIAFGLVFLAIVGTIIVVIRTMLLKKDLTQTAMMFTGYVFAVYLFLAFIGPAIGNVTLANYEQIDDHAVDGKRYALGHRGATSGRISSYIFFECDRFMFRCKVLHNEPQNFSINSKPHLSIMSDKIELIIAGDVVYTHPVS